LMQARATESLISKLCVVGYTVYTFHFKQGFEAVA